MLFISRPKFVNTSDKVQRQGIAQKKAYCPLALQCTVHCLLSLTLILVKGASTVMHLSTARAMVVYTEPVRLMWIRANTYGVTKGNTYSWAFNLNLKYKTQTDT